MFVWQVLGLLLLGQPSCFKPPTKSKLRPGYLQLNWVIHTRHLLVDRDGYTAPEGDKDTAGDTAEKHTQLFQPSNNFRCLKDETNKKLKTRHTLHVRPLEDIHMRRRGQNKRRRTEGDTCM